MERGLVVSDEIREEVSDGQRVTHPLRDRLQLRRPLPRQVRLGKEDGHAASVARGAGTRKCGEPHGLARTQDDAGRTGVHDPPVKATGPTVRDAVVGREAELDRIHAFLGRRAELPAGLVIEGPAGAGKTTIWRAGVDAAAAAGYLVLSCRPAGAEVQLAHAALSDLLEPHIGAVLAGLPPPQRHAIEVALLLSDGGEAAPDQRAISAGVLNGIRWLARERPVLLAIDDAQWVDAPSAEVLEFAVRRLRDAPVAVLASRRVASSPGGTDLVPGGVRPEAAMERPMATMTVGPLSLGAMHRMLRDRTELDFNRRTLQRIHDASGGNPFYALELARALEGSAVGAEPLALSAGLNELLTARVRQLPDRTREALFVAAALTQPAVKLLAATMEESVDAIANALGPAARAGVATIHEDRVEFVHPLHAAAAYAALNLDQRRAWHLRIAAAAADIETRARHVALARPGKDIDVAQLLHDAGEEALARGAPGVAADLFFEAIERLPSDAEPWTKERWSVEAAPTMKLAGASDRAIVLLEAAIVSLPYGPDRSAAKRMLGELVESRPDGFQRSIRLADEAIEEAGTDMHRLAAALLDREMVERSTARLDLALAIARKALEAAKASGDVFLEAHGEVRMADLEVLLGLGGNDIEGRFARALELDKLVRIDAESTAHQMLSVCLIRAGRVDDARPRLLALRHRAAAEGDEASHAQVCLTLAELEWVAGNWEAAGAWAAEGIEIAEQSGNRVRLGSTTGLAALVEASRGDPDRARTIAERAVAICEETGDIGYERHARQIIGFLDLSLGDAAAAAASLDAYVLGHAIEGPKRICFAGDPIEALVQLGEIDRAAEIAEELAARGTEIKRPAMVASADRCRALIRAARGDMEGALAAAESAIAGISTLPLPFERARALLILGEVQRRAKQRKAARDTLTDAIAAFDALGAHLWVAKAEAERARIGGRTTIEGLSETELRVAQLVAEGKSNKEVAAALFVSVRAVEANLSRVYAKLGIESRTELVRRI